MPIFSLISAVWLLNNLYILYIYTRINVRCQDNLCVLFIHFKLMYSLTLHTSHCAYVIRVGSEQRVSEQFGVTHVGFQLDFYFPNTLHTCHCAHVTLLGSEQRSSLSPHTHRCMFVRVSKGCHSTEVYGLATISRLLKIIGLFCRI